MKATDLIPKLYKKNVEMNNIIDSEEVELENLENSIKNEFNNTFIINANEEGITRFEKLFNIVSDTNTETIEFRRNRIISRLLSKIPFTEKYLQNYLNIILGENNWSYVLNYNNYTLTITSLMPGRLWYNELVLLLKKIVPVNIDWSINIYQASWQAVEDTFPTWQNVYDNCDTWQDVLNGEWL